MRKDRILILIPILIMIFIFVQSALPADVSSSESGFLVSLIRRFWDADPELITTIVRKCGHFAEYLLLGWSLYFAVRLWLDSGKCVLVTWLIGTAYAVTDEIHQMFTEGRSCEIRDVAIDSAGVLAGIGIALLIVRHKRKKQKNEAA